MRVDVFAHHIWANAATPRCKYFLWLVHRHCLPSTALLHHWNIIDSPACAFCGAHEDQDHLLLRCPRARRVWCLLGWDTAPHLSSFRELWDYRELPDGTEPPARSAVITAVLWNLWKGRNALVFNSVHVPPHHTILVTASDLDLWKHRLKHPATIMLWSLSFRNNIN